MFTHYRTIIEDIYLKEIEDLDKDNIIETFRTFAEKNKWSDQTKKMLQAACELASSNEDIDKIIFHIIELDKTLEQRNEEQSICTNEQPENKETRTGIKPAGKRKSWPMPKHFAFDEKDIIGKQDQIYIYRPILEDILNMIPDPFSKKDVEEAVFEAFKKRKRKISKASSKAYGNTYTKYIIRIKKAYKIIDKEGLNRDEKAFSRKKKKPEEELDLEKYIIKWAEENNNQVRPMGIKVALHFDKKEAMLNDIEEKIEEMRKKGMLSKIEGRKEYTLVS